MAWNARWGGYLLDLIGSRQADIAYTRLADGDRTDTGHHLALRQVTVADDALVAVPGLQIGMLAEKGPRPRPRPPWREGQGPRCARLL